LKVAAETGRVPIKTANTPITSNRVNTEATWQNSETNAT
jgi:hypothetical protein